MLYARRIDNTLILAAADTVTEFETFVAPLENVETPDFMALLTNQEYKGLKYPPRILHFEDENDLLSFLTINSIELVKKNQLVDLNKAMVRSLKEEVTETRTLYEIHNLEAYNPWDKRTPEQIEKDKRIEERIKQAEKEGKLTSDSFGPGKLGGINVNKVTQLGAGESVTISVTAHKNGGLELEQGPITRDPVEISEDLSIPHEGRIAVFHKVVTNKTSVDIAAIVDDLDKISIVVRENSHGCWFAVPTQRIALDLVEKLKNAGVEAETYPVNIDGEQLLPSGVRMAEQEEEIIGPRPWSDGWDVLSYEQKQEEIKKIKPTEFFVAGFEAGLYGCEFYIVPKTHWKLEGALWFGELPVDHIIPQIAKRGKTPGYFKSGSDWNRMAFILNQGGFREHFHFQCYLNGERYSFDSENKVHR